MPDIVRSEPAARGRRLSPEARRDHILDAARRLFSERPPGAVTTADVAEAAGVARSLVHHYFGGIAEVFIAVVARGGAALTDVRTAGPETPLQERIAHNVGAGLDVVAANRETWLAVAGHGTATADPRIVAIVEAAAERSIDRMLTANADLLSDTRDTRFALRCFNAFSTEATSAWLRGRATREQAETLLAAAFLDLVLQTLPRLHGD
jgi:AcrR family transcriptional regulator